MRAETRNFSNFFILRAWKRETATNTPPPTKERGNHPHPKQPVMAASRQRETMETLDSVYHFHLAFVGFTTTLIVPCEGERFDGQN